LQGLHFSSGEFLLLESLVRCICLKELVVLQGHVDVFLFLADRFLDMIIITNKLEMKR
jgi:hypothetical protein